MQDQAADAYRLSRTPYICSYVRAQLLKKPFACPDAAQSRSQACSQLHFSPTAPVSHAVGDLHFQLRALGAQGNLPQLQFWGHAVSRRGL